MAIQVKDLYNAYQNPDQAGNVLLYGATNGRFGGPLTSASQEDALGSIAPVRPGMDQSFEPYQVAGLNNVAPPTQRRSAVTQQALPVAAPVEPVALNANGLNAPKLQNGVGNTQIPPGEQAISPEQSAAAANAAPVTSTVAQPAIEPPHPMTLLDKVNEEKDPTKRYAGYQKMVVDPNLDEGTRKIAADNMLKALQQQQQEAKAMREMQAMSPNDLARAIKRDTEEGSFLKYFLASRLGLNELAGKEADKLGYTNTRSAEMLPSGEKYYVERRKDGTVVGAMDTTGNYVPQDVLSRLATEALPTKGAKAEVGVNTVVSNKTGQIGKVVTQQFGSQTRTFIESEGKMYPANGNEWKPQTEVTQLNVMRQKLMESLKYVEPTKRMEVAAKFDQENNTNFAAQLKQDMPEYFGAPSAVAPSAVAPSAVAPVVPSAEAPAPAVPAPAVEAPAASVLPQSPTIKVISGQRSNAEQQALYDQSVRAGTPGRLPNGNPVAKPGTSLHESDNAVDIDNKALTKQDRIALAQNGWYQPLPGKDPNHWERAQPTVSETGVRPGASIAEIERAKKQRADAEAEARKKREELFKSEVAVTEADRKDFVDYKNKTVQPGASNGQTVSEIRREQISGPNGLLTNPSIIGIMQNQGSTYKEAKNLLRDMISGNFQDADEVSKKIANLDLKQTEKDALYNFNMLNTRINSLTLKQNAGPGAISDAEQRANKAANVDVVRAPVVGAFTQLTRGQFMADMDLYKNDWLSQRPEIQTQQQFQKAWSAEERRLKDQYDSIYGKRAEYIGKHGSTPDAAVAGFKYYPQPVYNPQSKKWEITGYSAGATRPSIGSFVR